MRKLFFALIILLSAISAQAQDKFIGTIPEMTVIDGEVWVLTINGPEGAAIWKKYKTSVMKEYITPYPLPDTAGTNGFGLIFDAVNEKFIYRQLVDQYDFIDSLAAIRSDIPAANSVHVIATLADTSTITSPVVADIAYVSSDTMAIRSSSAWLIFMGGSGGSSTLAALSDVDTTGVENNSILKYNSVSGAWEIGTDLTSVGATGHVYMDDGTPITQRDTADFIGAELTDSGTKTSISYPRIFNGGTFTSTSTLNLLENATPSYSARYLAGDGSYMGWISDTANAYVGLRMQTLQGVHELGYNLSGLRIKSGYDMNFVLSNTLRRYYWTHDAIPVQDTVSHVLGINASNGQMVRRSVSSFQDGDGIYSGSGNIPSSTVTAALQTNSLFQFRRQVDTTIYKTGVSRYGEWFTFESKPKLDNIRKPGITVFTQTNQTEDMATIHLIGARVTGDSSATWKQNENPIGEISFSGVQGGGINGIPATVSEGYSTADMFDAGIRAVATENQITSNKGTRLDFYTRQNSSTARNTVLRLGSDKTVTLPTYDGTNQIGTPTYMLGVTSTGQIVKDTIPTGGGADGNGLFSASNDGGTVPTGMDIILTDTLQIDYGGNKFTLTPDLFSISDGGGAGFVDIDLSGNASNSFSLTGPAGGNMLLDPDGYVLTSPYGTVLALQESSVSQNFRLTINPDNGTGQALIQDSRATKIGLEYAGDYSTAIKTNARSIPDVGIVKDLISDSLATMTGDGYLKDDLETNATTTIAMGTNNLTITGTDADIEVQGSTSSITLDSDGLSTNYNFITNDGMYVTDDEDLSYIEILVNGVTGMPVGVPGIQMSQYTEGVATYSPSGVSIYQGTNVGPEQPRVMMKGHGAKGAPFVQMVYMDQFSSPIDSAGWYGPWVNLASTDYNELLGDADGEPQAGVIIRSRTSQAHTEYTALGEEMTFWVTPNNTAAAQEVLRLRQDGVLESQVSHTYAAADSLAYATKKYVDENASTGGGDTTVYAITAATTNIDFQNRKGGLFWVSMGVVTSRTLTFSNPASGVAAEYMISVNAVTPNKDTITFPSNLLFPSGDTVGTWVADRAQVLRIYYDGSTNYYLTSEIYGIVQGVTPASSTSVTIDLKERPGSIFQIDCTTLSTASTITLTASNPAAGIYTFHFQNTGSTNSFDLPATFLDQTGTALDGGTTYDINASDVWFTCYYDGTNYYCK